MLQRILLCILLPVVLFAQGTDLGTIRGVVTDASGALVPGAKVTLTDVSTNTTQVLTTNDAGEYEASAVKSGEYKVLVAAPGFSSTEVRGILLQSSQTARADARLQVSRANESVVVEADAPLIQTDNPTISSTLNNRTLIEIPRDSRDYQSYLYLNPNITQGASDGAFKFVGAQSYGASFSLDGQRANGGVFGEPTASQPSLETIGEITVLSNSFTAEYAGIANVRVTTKRGGANYHGSIFYNNKNSALAALTLDDKNGINNFIPTAAQQNYPNPYFNLNEFGGSLGGRLPFLKKTFFYAAYEKRFQNSPVYERSTTLPHPLLWTGDFSRVNDANKPLVPAGVTLTDDEKAQNTVGGLGQRFIRIPTRLLSPYTSALIKNYYPQNVSTSAPINASNGRLIEYFTNLPGTQRRDLGTMRVDHDFSERDRLYGVYNVQQFTGQTAPVVAPFLGLGLTQNERSNHTFSLSETHLFTPSLINEARGGFNYQPNFRRSNQTLRQFLQKIGFSESDINAYGQVTTPNALDTFGHPAVAVTGFQSFSNGGRNTYRPLDQDLFTLGDTLTWIKGRHTFKAGADIVRNHAVDGFTSGRGNPRGLITYSGTSLDAWTRFLIGLPANQVSTVNQFRPPMDVANWEHGYYVMDDFKIHPRVTLNLGLRYEIITPFTEANDLLVNFDPTYVGANGQKGRFIIPSNKTLTYLNPLWIAYGYATADQIGVPRSLVKPDYNNFAPRLGVAWRVTDSTVIRGGWGTFYPTSAAQGIRDPLATNSFQVGLTRRNTTAAPLGSWPNPLTGGSLNALSGLPGGNWVPFDLQSPRIQQYNVTVEQEIGWKTAVRLSYLGSRMSGLISGREANILPPSDTPFGTTTGDGVTPCSTVDGDCALTPAENARRPFPGLGDYLLSFGNYGHGRSHAFQTEVNRRFSGGLQFNFSYTYLDQKSTAPDTGNSSLGGTAYSVFNPESDYGMDAFTAKHRFIAYGIVESPLGRGRRYGANMNKAVDYAIGGWQLSWQMFAKSGYGFTPYWFCDGTCGGGGFAYPGNVGAGSIDAIGDFSGGWRPTVNGNPNKQVGDRLWDPSVYGPPPFGAGLLSGSNVAVRNSLNGPGTYGLNLGIRKFFALGERARAELGADADNVLNHPLLSPNVYDMANLGTFGMTINPTTLKPEVTNITPNPDFGRLIHSYSQEGIDSRRSIRLRLRIQF